MLALNQLLAEWGFLRFRREPSRGEDVNAVVGWCRSLAVAWGGYYARVFINAVGEEAVDVKRELRRRLSVLKAPWGCIRNVVFEPAELYRAVRGDAPDLMVYFDSLRVRPVQTMGYESPWLEGNDRGLTTRFTASTVSTPPRRGTRGVRTSTRWTWLGFWRGCCDVWEGVCGLAYGGSGRG